MVYMKRWFCSLWIHIKSSSTSSNTLPSPSYYLVKCLIYYIVCLFSSLLMFFSFPTFDLFSVLFLSIFIWFNDNLFIDNNFSNFWDGPWDKFQYESITFKIGLLFKSNRKIDEKCVVLKKTCGHWRVENCSSLKISSDFRRHNIFNSIGP